MLNRCDRGYIRVDVDPELSITWQLWRGGLCGGLATGESYRLVHTTQSQGVTTNRQGVM